VSRSERRSPAASSSALEVAAASTFILAVAAVAEATAVANGGRSYTDRLLGTSVVTTR
jgi:hypothetical protein